MSIEKDPYWTRVIILKYAHKHISLDGKLRKSAHSEVWIKKNVCKNVYKCPSPIPM